VKHVATVPPRSYIVGFRQTGLGKTYSDFRVSLQRVLEEKETFVHGVCVLDRNWFTGRIAFKPASDLYGKDGNALQPPCSPGSP
jgi:hypothetical protein